MSLVCVESVFTSSLHASSLPVPRSYLYLCTFYSFVDSDEVADAPGLPTHCLPEPQRKNDKSSSLNVDDLSKCPQPPCSVRLIDDEERILFDDVETLAWQLGCPLNRPVKLIAIVGNTGDGKSHTLNHAFCGGLDVFVTSPSQVTCTIGIWAAYLPKDGYLLIDTEGLLGASPNPNRQKRLLLKVFALADVVIYRTMSDRLHSDMFTFLADASDAFAGHFRPDLEALAERTGLPWTSGELGPAVVIFQETQHTKPLDQLRGLDSVGHDLLSDRLGSAEPSSEKLSTLSSNFISDRIKAMKRNVNAFSALIYVGTQTKIPPTNFQPLASRIADLVRDTSIRAPRKLIHIFHILQALNTRFSTDLPATTQTFVDEYFTCPAKCTSCGARCHLGVNHLIDGINHSPAPLDKMNPSKGLVNCRYDPVLQNKLYFCKMCYAFGQKSMMVPKSGEANAGAFSAVVQYLWCGYVLECPRHGTIYRSRGYWSGNVEPEQNPRIHWEVVHVWPGEKSILLGTHPVSQLLVDGLTAVSNQVTLLAGPPARRLGDLIADSVAPDYWQPNSSIKACSICKFVFPDTLGSDLDTNLRIVDEEDSHNDTTLQRELNKSSKLLEQLPKVLIDDGSKHHCRACGRGVCARCSMHRLKVPDQGYGSEEVRVCDQCYEKRITENHHNAGNYSPERTITRSKSLPKLPQSSLNQNISSMYGSNLTGRKVIEMISATADYISPIYTGPKELVKSLARPEYWQPDELCISCSVCSAPFGLRRVIHHCRSCGQGVCGPCSRRSRPVPERGLDFPTRVCDTCFIPPEPARQRPTPHKTMVKFSESLKVINQPTSQSFQSIAKHSPIPPTQGQRQNSKKRN